EVLPHEEIDALAIDGSEETEPLDGLIDVADDLEIALPATEVDFPASAEVDTDLDLDFADEPPPAPVAGLPLIEAEPASEPMADEVTALESRIVDDPENPDLHRELA